MMQFEPNKRNRAKADSKKVGEKTVKDRRK